ncbi:peptide-methionine (S)-S-oxide reductase MsrA, partial [Patescibacteria group bacterium]|nr:peptide-methionine (S)-S-oxide reductase MsrA [Patescibacteria group bacterium]
VFKSLKGVIEVVPGYMGGDVPNPSYEEVCTGTTGHAEVIKVYYDNTIISTDDLLDIFFATHDPSTLNQQGNDIGTQYRSSIFYTHDQVPHSLGGPTDSPDDDVPGAIERAINRAQATLPENKIVVTAVVSATEFYPAEEYHQNYYAEHSTAPYCQIVISPKLEKLQKKFADKLLE